jgi:O-succinylbenzoate synthase
VVPSVDLFDGLTSGRPPRLRLHHIRVPLVEPLVTARGVVHERESILVQAHDDEDPFDGWGECVTLPGLDYPLAPLEQAWDALAGAHDSPGPRPANASAALADALLDRAMRAAGVSLAQHLAGDATPRTRVPSARVLGIAGSIEALLGAAQAAVDMGHRHLVCKVRPGWDVEPVRALRHAFPSVGLAVDANGSFSPEDPVLRALDEVGLAWIEQPVAPDDLDGSARLAQRLETPVALDESVVAHADVERALRLGAMDVLNVKPGRIGGTPSALSAAELAAAAGCAVLVGGRLETGIGRAAALALAAHPVVTLPTDLGPSARYLDPDLTEPFLLDADGMLAVPTAPGIGVTPDATRLAELTVRVLDVPS